jgi:hypothetical protein
MPFLNKSPVIVGTAPAIFPSGSEVVVQRAQITAATADVASNSVGAFAILPAGCVPVGVHIDADAAVSADVGIVDNAETAVSTAAADGGAAWASALAANGTSMSFTKAMARVQPAQADRKVGIKVTTAGTAGVVGMSLAYRAA